MSDRGQGTIPCRWGGVVGALLMVACSRGVVLDPPPVPVVTPTGPVQQALVTRVVDGDTIRVLLGGREYAVRYIGVDAPEVRHPTTGEEPYGQEATEFNQRLVEGKTVVLEKDVSQRDRYGRLLRYVYVEGRMVNALLVAGGYAQAVGYPPDVKYQDLLLQLQREARAGGRGLWGLGLKGEE